MCAAQFVHVPGYAALIFRRTYADLALPSAIMDRAKTWWLPLGVHWDEQRKRFTFPSGATVSFGYLDTDADRYRYQGAELQCLCFDELTQFPEGWYRYLLSRLRRLRGSAVALRARSASNPGGIGHDWVRRRFVDVPASGPADREFVPAALEDNPYLDRNAYEASLARLDPVTHQQLRKGVWIRDGGGLVYGHFDEARNLIEQAPQKPGEALGLDCYLLGLDFGIDDENACTVLGWRVNDPCIYVVESYRIKAIVSEMCEEVRRLEDRYKFVQIVGDTGGMGKAFTTEISARYSIPIDPAEKNNKVGYISMFNADLARGRIKVVAPQCGDLLAEWRELPWNETRTKESEGFRNHASDSALYAWRACTAYHNEPADQSPPVGTPAYYAAQEQAILDRLEKNLEEKQRRQWWE